MTPVASEDEVYDFVMKESRSISFELTHSSFCKDCNHVVEPLGDGRILAFATWFSKLAFM
jgi:hypothetical protein